MRIIARHALVSGHVQGVAFRHHAKLRARALGLAGWVRNRGDGRVEAWFEGPEQDVRSFEDWLQRGPPAAHVAALDVDAVEPAGHAEFKVRFD